MLRRAEKAVEDAKKTISTTAIVSGLALAVALIALVVALNG